VGQNEDTKRRCIQNQKKTDIAIDMPALIIKKTGELSTAMLYN